jgi:peroxiredoxin
MHLIHRKLWPVIGLLLVMAVAVVAGWFLRPTALPAPEVTLLHLDGQRVTLSELRGKPVILNFWASDCEICLTEQPDWVALHEELAPLGLQLVGVAMPYDPPNRVVEWVEQQQLPYPVALDLDGEVAHAFGPVRVTPTTVLIDGNGNIRWTRLGVLDMAALRDELRQLL